MDLELLGGDQSLLLSSIPRGANIRVGVPDAAADSGHQQDCDRGTDETASVHGGRMMTLSYDGIMKPGCMPAGTPVFDMERARQWGFQRVQRGSA
jgi:hypothetical protein